MDIANLIVRLNITRIEVGHLLFELIHATAVYFYLTRTDYHTQKDGFIINLSTISYNAHVAVAFH
jgi:hypothetical protein